MSALFSPRPRYRRHAVVSAGAAIMIATFTVWPLVAVSGVVLQAIALKHGLTFLVPVAVTRLRRWAQAARQNSVPGLRHER